MSELLGKLDVWPAITATLAASVIMWLLRQNSQLQKELRQMQAELREQEKTFAKAVLAVGRRYREDVRALIHWLKR